MKKWIAFLFVLIGLAGCGDHEELVRVDYQMGEWRTGDAQMITEESQVRMIESIFKKVKWENAKVQMDRKKELILTFFYRYDPNEPERLEEYQIWFNNEVTEIVDPNKNRYGILDEAEAQRLKEVIK
ncbi:hypothetical protein M3196_13205 [Fictibacillus nanhaiensis]|uniref:hypothetical protein n=1 Tax=Fictibacillus nanhaiensis TaxID=742169 RepID=UPI00203FC2C8|nr:hypothetical protein [Fictibacillus nanhaiensis]MCM3732624.1 hypothetical protein [Fictibacillus nanhaiensis]